MKVKRLDIYDYQITFTEDEFKELFSIIDNTGKYAEDIIKGVLKWGLKLLLHKQE